MLLKHKIFGEKKREKKGVDFESSAVEGGRKVGKEELPCTKWENDSVSFPIRLESYRTNIVQIVRH